MLGILLYQFGGPLGADFFAIAIACSQYRVDTLFNQPVNGRLHIEFILVARAGNHPNIVLLTLQGADCDSPKRCKSGAGGKQKQRILSAAQIGVAIGTLHRDAVAHPDGLSKAAGNPAVGVDLDVKHQNFFFQLKIEWKGR